MGIIRNETFKDGVCVAAAIIDADAGTVATEDHGVIVASRPMSEEERALYAPTSKIISAPIAEQAETDLPAAAATIEASLDPKAANPAQAARITALEQAVAFLLAQQT